ncbi:AlpA family transcriptional regulator [Methylobacterium sp. NEAU K]|uniref:helix-turn-helix transcriptional regulator n=1 Tax=Methylobacterium sp. NEAU K TaxID=3064946 RepID=UPI002736DA4A|nr:AlpA family phage regulatory protein [Methylobacterium sp. NEAU K]MDP4006164.1 AlpA family phage regulatory protein [Methylobacterium sp. NEAU K]
MNYHPDLPPTGFKTRAWVKLRYAISNSTLHQWQTDGYFPKSVKIGPRAVRFRVEDIREFEAKLLTGQEG